MFINIKSFESNENVVGNLWTIEIELYECYPITWIPVTGPLKYIKISKLCSTLLKHIMLKHNKHVWQKKKKCFLLLVAGLLTSWSNFTYFIYFSRQNGKNYLAFQRSGKGN